MPARDDAREEQLPTDARHHSVITNGNDGGMMGRVAEAAVTPTEPRS
jgi:hypothetical protein